MNKIAKSRILLKYNEQKRQIDERLASIVDDMIAGTKGEFAEALRYTILSGGKRIRPVLTLTIYDLFKKDDREALDAACALELFHASSLMLDDLPSMDDAAMRRGKSTSHAEFGESTTILAAAAIWTKAYELLADYPADEAKALSKITAILTGSKGLILGQYYDLQSQHSDKINTDELIKQYTWKTASLFRLAVSYAAICGHASTKQSRNLDDFAKNLGIAFQVHDDIIDKTMTVLETGKDSHKDQKNHKPNCVDVIGLDKAEARFEQYMQRASKAMTATGLDVVEPQSFVSSFLR